jgi:predicted esterase
MKMSSGGPLLADAKGAIILVHGRGASAESMLSLYSKIDLPELAAIAPQARGHSWYPQSFLAPLEANQPYLDDALNGLESIVRDVIEQNIGAEHIALLGFSQGACLTLEFVARNPRRYGAVIAFTGALIGRPGSRRKYSGTLSGTSVFLGTSDPDAHVPFTRVQETGEVLSAMGASVELRSYPGMPHTINDEELTVASALLHQMVDM